MKKKWIKGGYSSKSKSSKADLVKPCQDKFFIFERKDFVCIAAADGAGSALFSDIGSSIVTKGISKLLYKKFNHFYKSNSRTVKTLIISALRADLKKEAIFRNSSIEDFASTLLFACIKSNKIIAGHIGDGLILYNNHHFLHTLSKPENGEFLNQTYFVTSPYYLHHLRLYKGNTENIEGVYLMTDGISNLVYNTKSDTASPLFEKSLFKFNYSSDETLSKSIGKYLNESILKKTRDDATLVILRLFQNDWKQKIR